MYAERPEKSLKENLEFVKEIKGGVSPSTTMYMFKMYLDEALKKGEITKEKYNKMLMPFFGKASEGVTRDFERYEENMANGGRVGYAFGSGVKLAKFLAIRGKTLKDEIKKAVDNFMQPSGDKKLDADMILDDMLEELGTSRSEIDQKDIIEAYGDVYNTLSKGDEISAMAPKMRERFELKEKYPGIDEELVAKIVDDPDPQRKAEVLATIEQAFELMKQGKSSDEVLDIMKQMTDRTKQAGGGLSYLSGF
jgi:hypothetical protein